MKHTQGELKVMNSHVLGGKILYIRNESTDETMRHTTHVATLDPGTETAANAARLAITWNMFTELVAALAAAQSRLAMKCEATCMFQEDLEVIEAARSVLSRCNQ